MTDRTLTTGSPDETRAFAAALGRALQPGDVICLIGDLGAGKTTFTQGLAHGLDIPEEEPINSPTFTLVAEHHGGRIPLYHFDMYRLADSSDLYALAFDEYLTSSGIIVIEWADRIADALPPDRLEMTFTAPGDADLRHIEIRSYGPNAAQTLENLFGSAT